MSAVSGKLAPEWVKDQNGVDHYVVRTNPDFEAFYRAQKTCGSEDEWNECLAAMRRDLPQGFRLDLSTRSGSLKLMKNYLKLNHDDVLSKKPWGFGAIFQISKTSRWDLLETRLKHEKSEETLRKLSHFLHVHSELGHLSRQELVSMIPVLLLDVRPEHYVLDICASPGSKTKQVLSRMHELGGPVPSGMVIANEYDATRCDKLAHNASKVKSPCLLTVNHDGYNFPDLHDGDGALLKFDRIVCDVPCSGDGTIRKNPHQWNDWTPGAGNARHHIQYNIAERAVEMLKVGGLMAYSSCSMNPIENEAVLGRLLEVSKGNLELVDPRGKLEGFRYARGHETWKVFDSKMNEYGSYESVPNNIRKSQIHWSMFSSNYENKGYHLDRCMRLLPHHSDCGGFFVAILKKTGLLPLESNAMCPADAVSSRVKKRSKGELDKFIDQKIGKRPTVELGSKRSQVRFMWKPKSFFRFLDGIQDTLEFYGFPSVIRNGQFYTSSDKSKHIYLVNDNIRKLIESNILARDQVKVNLYHAGIKVFKKTMLSSNSTDYDIVPETRLCPLISEKRTCRVPKADMVKLLKTETDESVGYSDMSNEARNEFMSKVAEDGCGGVKIICSEDNDDGIEFIGHLGNCRVVLRADNLTKYHGLFYFGEI